MNMEWTQEEREQYNQAMDEWYAYIDSYTKANEKLISSIGETALADYYELIEEGTQIDGLAEFVAMPAGDKNEGEHCGVFTEVWVDQRSVGTEGDMFDGYLYFKFGENKWIKTPYQFN